MTSVDSPHAVSVTDQPFTAVVCQAGPCRPHGSGPDFMPWLAAVVRQCPQGVLVRTGCLLRAPRCQAGAAHDSGCYLLVQPCDTARQPYGAAIAVGPVVSRDDVQTVEAWLADGDLDADRLDPRLRVRWQPA
ncbi:hypothetical protein [Actinomadura rudentiformis]|uniref:hypothetical protein n=1 Tax=Actinomadura rudentiformis TaxID=359158 RepID=UPI00178C7542|nr:hypothetical protein [Actinomadura rudentiformis]